MKSDRRYTLNTLKSGYGKIEPDGWAVTRMKARLAREKYDPAEFVPRMVVRVFRRYVLASVLTVFAITAWLDYTSDTAVYVTDTPVVESWLLGELNDDIVHEIPEFTFLMEF